MIKCSRCGKTATRSENRLKEPVLYYYACAHCLADIKHEQGLNVVRQIKWYNITHIK
jgi:DNA-directed RNA polymerase subunit RPC12/RpoP